MHSLNRKRKGALHDTQESRPWIATVCLLCAVHRCPNGLAGVEQAYQLPPDGHHSLLAPGNVTFCHSSEVVAIELNFWKFGLDRILHRDLMPWGVPVEGFLIYY